VITNTQIESQPRSEMHVVLKKDVWLPSAIVWGVKDLVTTAVYIIAGEKRREIVKGPVAVCGVGLGDSTLTADDAGAEFDGLLATYVAHGSFVLKGILVVDDRRPIPQCSGGALVDGDSREFRSARVDVHVGLAHGGVDRLSKVQRILCVVQQRIAGLQFHQHIGGKGMDVVQLGLMSPRHCGAWIAA